MGAGQGHRNIDTVQHKWLIQHSPDRAVTQCLALLLPAVIQQAPSTPIRSNPQGNLRKMSSCKRICTQTSVCIPILWLKKAQFCWSKSPPNIWLRGLSLCTLLKMLAISTLRTVTPLTSQVPWDQTRIWCSEIHTMSSESEGSKPQICFL